MSDVLDHESDGTRALRAIAASYPETEEVGVCVNTSFKALGKAFAFVGAKPEGYSLRLKLKASLEEAERLAAETPSVYSVGKFGWTLVKLPHDERLPDDLAARWIDESFRLLAPKKLVKTVPPRF